MLKQRIIVTLWCLLAIAVGGLLIAAVQHKKHSVCSAVKVEIEDSEGHPFVDEKDIESILKKNGAEIGIKTNVINLRALESIIKKDAWVQNAELYFDNNEVLQVKIKERKPIARIFTVSGSSFYIDSAGKRLPLSNDYTAHVPVFTSFSSDKKHLSKPDSLLLNDVKNIARLVQQDSFWNAQVSQVVITSQSSFNIIPVVGNQTIILGSADSLESKFNRLFAFYKQVWAKSGFEKYETINVSFSNQVVATRRGEPKPYVDSVLAQRIVTAMRSGTDILKDSSLLFRQVDAMQKKLRDSTLQPQFQASVDTVVIVKKKNKNKHVIAAKPIIKNVSQKQ